MDFITVCIDSGDKGNTSKLSVQRSFESVELKLLKRKEARKIFIHVAETKTFAFTCDLVNAAFKADTQL